MPVLDPDRLHEETGDHGGDEAEPDRFEVRGEIAGLWVSIRPSPQVRGQ